MPTFTCVGRKGQTWFVTTFKYMRVYLHVFLYKVSQLQSPVKIVFESDNNVNVGINTAANIDE